MAYKRLYLGVVVTTLIGLFAYLASLGLVITSDGDKDCNFIYNNVTYCASYINVTNPKMFSVDIYNKNDVKMDFVPNVKNYYLFTKDGRCSGKSGSACCTYDNICIKGWRYTNFTDETKPVKDRVYVFRYAAYSTTQHLLLGEKNKLYEKVKWTLGVGGGNLDPIWNGIDIQHKLISTYSSLTEYRIRFSVKIDKTTSLVGNSKPQVDYLVMSGKTPTNYQMFLIENKSTYDPILTLEYYSCDNTAKNNTITKSICQRYNQVGIKTRYYEAKTPYRDTELIAGATYLFEMVVDKKPELGRVYVDVIPKLLGYSFPYAWWNISYSSCMNISLEESYKNRTNSPLEVNITELIFASTDELRIVNAGCNIDTGAEVPFDILLNGTTFVNVLFIANTTFGSNVTYSIYYDGHGVSKPDFQTDLSVVNGTFLFLNNSKIGIKIEDAHGVLKVLGYGGANWVNPGAVHWSWAVSNYSKDIFSYNSPVDCKIGFDGVVKKVISCHSLINTSHVLNYTMYAYGSYLSVYIDIANMNYTYYLSAITPEGNVNTDATVTYDTGTTNFGSPWEQKTTIEKWATIYKTSSPTKYMAVMWNGSQSRWNNGTGFDVNTTAFGNDISSGGQYLFPSAMIIPTPSVDTDSTRTFFRPSLFVFGFSSVANSINSSDDYKWNFVVPVKTYTGDIAIDTSQYGLTLNNDNMDKWFELGTYIDINYMTNNSFQNTSVIVCVDVEGFNLTCNSRRVSLNWLTDTKLWEFYDLTDIMNLTTPNATSWLEMINVNDVVSAKINVSGYNSPVNVMIDVGNDGNIDYIIYGELKGNSAYVDKFVNETNTQFNYSLASAGGFLKYVRIPRNLTLSNFSVSVTGSQTDKHETNWSSMIYASVGYSFALNHGIKAMRLLNNSLYLLVTECVVGDDTSCNVIVKKYNILTKTINWSTQIMTSVDGDDSLFALAVNNNYVYASAPPDNIFFQLFEVNGSVKMSNESTLNTKMQFADADDNYLVYSGYNKIYVWHAGNMSQICAYTEAGAPFVNVYGITFGNSSDNYVYAVSRTTTLNAIKFWKHNCTSAWRTTTGTFGYVGSGGYSNIQVDANKVYISDAFDVDTESATWVLWKNNGTSIVVSMFNLAMASNSLTMDNDNLYTTYLNGTRYSIARLSKINMSIMETNYTGVTSRQAGVLIQNNSMFYVAEAYWANTGNSVSIWSMEKSNLSSVKVDIGNDGINDYLGNVTLTSLKMVNNTTAAENYINKFCKGITCDVPVRFLSLSGGKFMITINVTYSPNPIVLNKTAFYKIFQSGLSNTTISDADFTYDGGNWESGDCVWCPKSGVDGDTDTFTNPSDGGVEGFINYSYNVSLTDVNKIYLEVKAMFMTNEYNLNQLNASCKTNAVGNVWFKLNFPWVDSDLVEETYAQVLPSNCSVGMKNITINFGMIRGEMGNGMVKLFVSKIKVEQIIPFYVTVNYSVNTTIERPNVTANVGPWSSLVTNSSDGNVTTYTAPVNDAFGLINHSYRISDIPTIFKVYLNASIIFDTVWGGTGYAHYNISCIDKDNNLVAIPGWNQNQIPESGSVVSHIKELPTICYNNSIENVTIMFDMWHVMYASASLYESKLLVDIGDDNTTLVPMYYPMPINFSNVSGVVELSGLDVKYLGNQNITITGYEQANFATTESLIAKIIYSKINVSKPYSFTESFLLYSPNKTATNVTPYGQSNNIPFYNITGLAYEQRMNITIRSNASLNSCMNITIGTNNKTGTTYRGELFNTNYFMYSNMSKNENIGIWIWFNFYDCNATVIQESIKKIWLDSWCYECTVRDI